jgi:hypothetical protein
MWWRSRPTGVVPLLPISLENSGFRSSAHAAEDASSSPDTPGLTEKRPRLTRLQQVGGALLPAASAIQDVGVDHRRLDSPMAEKLLHGADVVAGLEQVGGERMAKRVAVACWVKLAF